MPFIGFFGGDGGGGGGAVDSVNGQTGVVVLGTEHVADSIDKRYVTDAQLAVVGNTSGTNTGDQDLSGFIDGSLTAGRIPFASDSNTLTDSASITYNEATNLLTLIGESFTVGDVTACSITIDYGFLGNYYNSSNSTQGRIYAYKDTPSGRVYSTNYLETAIVTDNGAEDSNYGVVFSITPVAGADGYHIKLESNYEGSVFSEPFYVETTDTNYTYPGDGYDYGALPEPSILRGQALQLTGGVTGRSASFETVTASGNATVGGNLNLAGNATIAGGVVVTGNVSSGNLTAANQVGGDTGSFTGALTANSLTTPTATVTALNSTTGAIGTVSSTTLTNSGAATLGGHTYTNSGINFSGAVNITLSAGGFGIFYRGSGAINVTTNGGAAGSAGQFNFVGGAGATSTVSGAATNSAGIGGTMSLQSGAGGSASGSTSTNNGGTGGTVFLVGVVGGVASGNACVTNQSGAGGGISATTGAGGSATTAGAQNSRAGNGGSATFTAGSGGSASGGSVSNLAGAGGDLYFTGGNAGAATGTGAVGARGGLLAFTGGDGTVNGNGGTISIGGGVGAGSGTAGNVLLGANAGGSARGSVMVGALAGVTAVARMHVGSLTEQVRLNYNSSNYCSMTVGVTGSVTLNPVGTNPAIIMDKKMRLKGFTVASLPAGVQGDCAFVTDASAPTFLGALVGGGATVTKVFHNGTAWVAG